MQKDNQKSKGNYGRFFLMIGVSMDPPSLYCRPYQRTFSN